MEGKVTPRTRAQSDEVRSESRARLVQAGRKMFASKGFFACKVGDIARQAGMSQGNVYWYFSSKEEILQEILAEGFGAIETMTAEVADAPGPARRKIDLLIERTLALYAEHGEFARTLGTLMGQGGQELLVSLGFNMGEIGGRYHANLARLFTQARREKIVADVEPNLLVLFYFSLFNGALISYADWWPRLDPALVRQTVLRMLGVSKA
jgi:AcrR family transcriptional regulator